MKRDVSYMKPRGKKEMLTISETAASLECDISWLRKLESQNRIPKAARVRRGQIMVRLWTPEQVEEIREILAHHKVGRPANDA
jgi:DNA-binding transcriptional MerR regulator